MALNWSSSFRPLFYILLQVGQKLRDGPFGGCFMTQDVELEKRPRTPPVERIFAAFSDSDKSNKDYIHLSNIKVFCSRPKARIWEVDIGGTVLRTHDFKLTLLTSPRQITTDFPTNNNNTTFKKSIENINFNRLIPISNFLLTFTSNSFFILDPISSDIVLWCNQIEEIIDICVVSNVLYIWCMNGLKMHALNLVSLEKFLIRSYFWKKYSMVAELCIEFENYLLEKKVVSSKLILLKDLDVKLQEQDGCQFLLKKLEPILQKFKDYTTIKNQETSKILHKRPSFLNLKMRSHSVSPDRVQISAYGSTSSLPGLVQEENVALKCDNVELDKFKNLIALLGEFNFPAENDEVDRIWKSVFEGNDVIGKVVPFRAFLTKEQTVKLSKCVHYMLRTQRIIGFCEDFGGENTKDHPKVLKELLAGDLDLDFKVSQVLRVFLDVIEEEDVLDDLKIALPGCYYYCLLEILGKFEAISMTISDRLSPVRMVSVVLFLLKVR